MILLLKTLLEGTANHMAGAGVAEWLSRQPRDQTKEGKSQKWQDSWWASCSQGFESLPRRHIILALISSEFASLLVNSSKINCFFS